MSHKSIFSIFLFTFMAAALFIFLGCNASDNDKNSVTSGTTSGSGSSGGPAANVIVFAANNAIAAGATTTITVIVTDASGKRTDASIILTSSRGGKFNVSTTESFPSLNGNTIGGILIVNYTSSVAGDDEVTATVTGTILKGTTIITVS